MSTYQKIFAVITIIFLFGGASILFWPKVFIKSSQTNSKQASISLIKKRSIPIIGKKNTLKLLPQSYLNKKQIKSSFFSLIANTHVQMKVRLKNTIFHNQRQLKFIHKNFCKNYHIMCSKKKEI